MVVSRFLVMSIGIGRFDNSALGDAIMNNILVIVSGDIVSAIAESVYGMTTAAARVIAGIIGNEPVFVTDQYGFEYTIVAMR